MANDVVIAERGEFGGSETKNLDVKFKVMKTFLFSMKIWRYFLDRCGMFDYVFYIYMYNIII